MRLSESSEQAGYFWLPRNETNKLPGILRVESDGEASLEIIGTFHDELSIFNNETAMIGRIVGTVEKNGFVTLEKCFYKKTNISLAAGVSKSNIHVNYLLRGAQYEAEEEIVFNRFKFSVEGLDEWLSISGIQVDFNMKAPSATIYYQPPKEIAIKLDDGFILKFTFSWTLHGLPNITETKVSQRAYIELYSNSSRHLTDYQNLAWKINNFLCFAIDKTVSITSAFGFSTELTRDHGDGEKSEEPIEIIYKSSPDSENATGFNSRNMFFGYKEIADRLESTIKFWLQNYEKSEPAFNLYFASKSGTHQYLEGRFLFLIQGIETLHRRNTSATSMPKDEFNSLIKILVEGCPENKKKWLSEKLGYANELSLRQRIRQMIAPFEKMFGQDNERTQFINNVTDTRNYLTHYDSRLSKKAAKGAELIPLCMKLEALFQLHFLKLIGLNDDFINGLVNKNLVLKRKLRFRAAGWNETQ